MRRPAVGSVAAVLIGIGVVTEAVATDLSASARRALDYEQRRHTALSTEPPPHQQVELLSGLVAEQPLDGESWQHLAEAYASVGDYAAAEEAVARAIELGFVSTPNGWHSIATLRARAGALDDAIAALESARDSGHRFPQAWATDPRFEPLQAEPRFQGLAGRTWSETDREAGWRMDLRVLIDEVRRTHHRFRREPLPAPFREAHANLLRTMGERSDAEMIAGIQSLLSTLGDGHTLVYPFGMLRGNLTRLPLTLYFFSDGLFVIDAEDERHIGLQVLEMGNRSVAELERGLARIASHDNGSGLRWVGATYLTIPVYLREIGCDVDDDAVTLRVWSEADGHRSVTVPARQLDPTSMDSGWLPRPKRRRLST